ncbi:glycosyltransferase family 4 protein [Candidatus Sumerlaeota bacterium]|nr:glycosyltransferase family 4 protein [Candidatus Sumerlaeota bacterium]
MKYRILLVSHSSEVSGAPRALLYIASSLSRDAFDLFLCAPEAGGIAAEAEKNGIPVKIIPNPQIGFNEERNPLKKLKILYKRLCFIRNFRREVKKGRYDLIYMNSSASFYAGIALLGLKVRTIWHIHEDLNPNFLNRLKARLIAKSAVRIVFVSPSNIPCFAPYLSNKKYQITPNGVQIEKIERFSIDEEYRRLFNYNPEDRIIGMISFISRRKGVDIFLKALSRILPEYPRIKGVIAGDKNNADSRYLDELDMLLQIPELKDHAFFPGHCANIPSFLNSVEIFVLPSRNDPMPLVLLEAMAAGKAIVAADVGCVREMLDPPNAGVVVPPENPEMIAEEVLKLLNDPDKRTQMGQNARERARQRYSMETFRRKIDMLIEDALR